MGMDWTKSRIEISFLEERTVGLQVGLGARLMLAELGELGGCIVLPDRKTLISMIDVSVVFSLFSC